MNRHPIYDVLIIALAAYLGSSKIHNF